MSSGATSSSLTPARGRRSSSTSAESTAKPLDVLFPPAPTEIAHGQHKAVWRVVGRDDLVIAVTHERGSSEQLVREVELLKQLRRAGIPTVEVVAFGQSSEGRSASVMKRYEACSKDSRTVFDRWINDRTVKSYAKLCDAARKAGLWVTDAQVLIDDKGEVVLSDPLEIVPLKQGERPYVQFLEEAIFRYRNQGLSESDIFG